MKFEVEHEGQKFELEAPSVEEGIKALQPYIGGGMQQAAAPGTNTEMGSDEERWAPNPLVMAGNLPSSAYEMGKGIANTVAHPIDTAQNVYNLGIDGFTQMLSDRYGSWSNAVKTMENDPAGFFADLSMVAGPTGMGLRAAGVAGKAGALGKVGAVATRAAELAAKTDPFAAAASVGGKAIANTGKLASTLLGHSTGTGGSVATAAEAGYKGALSSKAAGAVLDKTGLGAAKGGTEGEAFLKYNSGAGDPDAVVEKAKKALGDSKFAESISHAKDLDPILNDPSKLDFKHIDQAIQNIEDRHVTKSGIQSPVEPSPAVQKVMDHIEYYRKGGVSIKGKKVPVAPGSKKLRAMEWSDLPDDPNAWTMDTFHQMRRVIGKEMGKIPYNDPARVEVGKIYGAVRGAVDDAYSAASPNAPKYTHILKDYKEAMDKAEEITKTFSLKEGVPADTALRKLHSIMRTDTTHGNFGARARLAQALVDMGHKDLMYEIAGMHTRPALRSTLVSLGGSLGSGAAAYALSPWFLGTLVAFSPKLIGRAAYTSGKVAGSVIKPAMVIQKALQKMAGKAYTPVKKIAQYGAFQAGRAANAGKNKEELKASLIDEAQKRGFNIHGRVLNSIADKIMSDDPNGYLQGVRMVGRNPRLLKLFLDMGTKGEQ